MRNQSIFEFSRKLEDTDQGSRNTHRVATVISTKTTIRLFVVISIVFVIGQSLLASTGVLYLKCNTTYSKVIII